MAPYSTCEAAQGKFEAVQRFRREDKYFRTECSPCLGHPILRTLASRSVLFSRVSLDFPSRLQVFTSFLGILRFSWLLRGLFEFRRRAVLNELLGTTLSAQLSAWAFFNANVCIWEQA